MALRKHMRLIAVDDHVTRSQVRRIAELTEPVASTEVPGPQRRNAAPPFRITRMPLFAVIHVLCR